MSRAKHWCFTVNNPTEADAESLSLLECVYIVWQKEKGENGTPHFQGVVGFDKQLRLNAVKQLLPRSHLEIARDVQASIKYCQKEEGRLDGPWIRGDVPTRTQGKRSDLDDVKEKVLAGTSMRELATEHFGATAKYFRALQSLTTMFQPPRDFVTKVYVFWGPTNCGKTYAALKFPTPYKTHSVAKAGVLWFDSYDPAYHETVIVDEFYGGLRWTELLQLTDRYPHLVQTKGGMVQFRAKNIIFTSNSRPESWYPNMDFAPFKRRILTGGLFHFPKRGEILLEMDVNGEPMGTFPPELMHQPSPDITYHESDDE